MTLTTEMYITALHPKTLFRSSVIARQIIRTLCEVGGKSPEIVLVKTQYIKDTHIPIGAHEYRTVIDQGLPAICEITISPELIPDTWFDWDRDMYLLKGEGPPTPAHHIKVWLDTAYGYSDNFGNDCGDLHAKVIKRLAAEIPNTSTTFWSESHDLYLPVTDENLYKYLGEPG